MPDLRVRAVVVGAGHYQIELRVRPRAGGRTYVAASIMGRRSLQLGWTPSGPGRIVDGPWSFEVTVRRRRIGRYSTLPEAVAASVQCVQYLEMDETDPAALAAFILLDAPALPG